MKPWEEMTKIERQRVSAFADQLFEEVAVRARRIFWIQNMVGGAVLVSGFVLIAWVTESYPETIVAVKTLAAIAVATIVIGVFRTSPKGSGKPKDMARKVSRRGK